MRRSLPTILSAVIAALFISQAQCDEWRVHKSTHFLIYYNSATEDFIRRTADYAETYYDNIAQELGFTRFNFWLWDKRAHIYIYDSEEEYQRVTGHPAWSGGAASPHDKIIYSFVDAQGFAENVLPHEMGHIIFREFVGSFNPAVPLWLEEGVASYQEKGKYSAARSTVKRHMSDGSYIPLDDLSSVGALLLFDKQRALVFYAEAYTVVDFLMSEYGRDSFVYFCQNLRDKQNLDRAISSAYPLSGLNGLQEAWKKWILK